MSRRLTSRSSRDYDRGYSGSRSHYDHRFYRFRVGSDSGLLSVGDSGGSFEDGVPSSYHRRHISARYSGERGGYIEYANYERPSNRSRSYMSSRQSPVDRRRHFDDDYSESSYDSGDIRDSSPSSGRRRPGSFDGHRSPDCDSYDSRPESSGYDSSGYSSRDFYGDDELSDRGSYAGSSRYSNPPYEDDYRSRDRRDYSREEPSSPEPAYSDRDSRESNYDSDFGSPNPYGYSSASISSNHAVYGGSVASGRGPSGRYYCWPAPYPESSQGGSPAWDPSVYPHDGTKYLFGYRGFPEPPRR